MKGSRNYYKGVKQVNFPVIDSLLQVEPLKLKIRLVFSRQMRQLSICQMLEEKTLREFTNLAIDTRKTFLLQRSLMKNINGFVTSHLKEHSKMLKMNDPNTVKCSQMLALNFQSKR